MFKGDPPAQLLWSIQVAGLLLDFYDAQVDLPWILYDVDVWFSYGAPIRLTESHEGAATQGITFGYCFNQNLENVTLNTAPQSTPLVGCFNQSLTVGYRFNQSLENVKLTLVLQGLAPTGRSGERPDAAMPGLAERSDETACRLGLSLRHAALATAMVPALAGFPAAAMEETTTATLAASASGGASLRPSPIAVERRRWTPEHRDQPLSRPAPGQRCAARCAAEHHVQLPPPQDPGQRPSTLLSVSCLSAEAESRIVEPMDLAVAPGTSTSCPGTATLPVAMPAVDENPAELWEPRTCPAEPERLWACPAELVLGHCLDRSPARRGCAIGRERHKFFRKLCCWDPGSRVT